MKKIIQALFFLFILNLFYPAWAKSYTDFSRPLLVTANNPSISIELPDNPSTGYQWVLTGYDHDLIKPVGEERIKANAEQPGKPGVVIFKFNVQKEAFVISQRFKITLEYLRPWESTAAKVLSIDLITQRD